MPCYENKITFSFTFDFLRVKRERKGEKSMGKNENEFQSKLIKELKVRFPGCIVTKLDANHIQGIPDLLILWNDRWAVLECKKSAKAKHQPNQDYYVKRLDEMSFSRFIFPENKESVLDELQSAFQS